MGVSKTELFTDQQIELAEMAKALGHPARVSILQLLSKIEGCICGDLVNEIGLSQPTISQHLTVLKNAGLICGEVKGASRCYCLDQKALSRFRSMLSGFIDHDVDTKSNRCC